MLRWAFLISMISLVAFVLVGVQMPPSAPPQPIHFSHKFHLDYFMDGHHRRAMLAKHEQLLGEDTEEVREGLCTLCHGDFEEAAEDTPRILHCAECHRVFHDRDWTGRQDQKPCMGCHNGVVDFPRASIPNIGNCAACHVPPLRGGPEEVKLLGFIERETRVSWARVYDYLPGDIVFSHERHAEVGRVRCQECHAAVERAERPLALEMKLSMEDCMACHDALGADNDCLACHR